MPNHLFISYRRASWSFTGWLADELSKLLDADIFVDFTGIDATDFEPALLRNLRQSDAVVLIVTEQTFDPARIHNDKDWVRREIREALTTNNPIALALVNGLTPPADIPDDIQAIRGKQGIEFYQRFFKAGVQDLAAFLDRSTPVKLRQGQTIASAPMPSSVPKAHKALLDDAITLFEAGQYAQSISLFDRLIAEKYTPRLVSLAELRAKAVHEQQLEQRRWEAGDLYDELVTTFRIMPEKVAASYEQFRADYPEFTEDPAGLGVKVGTWQARQRRKPPQVIVTPPKLVRSVAAKPSGIALPSVPDFLPKPFGWCAVTAGSITLEDDMGTHDVEPFVIAQYPITNGQFEVFVKAKEGYNDARWWDFSDPAKQWREENKLSPSYFKGDSLPRTDVCWYETMAFCRWLSAKTNLAITLSTDQQWQRAAQGDDGRAYPWGNDFDQAKCNTSESDIGQTTPVGRYPKGQSPFGVFDLAGNVWEWCLTEYGSGSQDIHSAAKRVLRGGSWNLSLYYARAAYRGYDDPDCRDLTVGFRVVVVGLGRPPSL